MQPPRLTTSKMSDLLSRIVYPKAKYVPIDWNAVRELGYYLMINKADSAIIATVSKFIEDWVASNDYPDYIHDNPNTSLTIHEYINQIFINKDYSEMDYFEQSELNSLISIYKNNCL